jgi:para-nitrobenzyl esterase
MTSVSLSEPVRIHSGLIVGEVLDPSVNLQAFRGIPYAAPPIGDLRWRLPQDVMPWSDVRECVQFGAVCPQVDKGSWLMGGPLPPQDEDCLFLNIWTTNAGGDEKLPVMVWIHGGGFTGGWSNQCAYEGSEFAKRGVVLVTINYRVGPLGNLAHPALSTESGRDLSGNYGFLDQIATLNWVQENISAFGGDSGNVTIFGESAGGSSVEALCVSPLAKGLFHRAIAQSPAGSQYAHLKRGATARRSAEEIGEAWASEFEGTNSGDVIAVLRQLTADEIIAKSAGFKNVVAIDDWFMPDFPRILFAQGKQYDVPLLVGTNADEGTAFVDLYRYETVEDYRNGAKKKFKEHADAVLALYPVARDDDIPEALNLFMSDTEFLLGATDMLRGMAMVSSPGFQYFFTRGGTLKPEWGAFHSAEMYYVFNTLHSDAEKSDDPGLADAMIRYWVQFARMGDPNVKGLPDWPEYEADSAHYLELGEAIKAGTALHHDGLEVLRGTR